MHKNMVMYSPGGRSEWWAHTPETTDVRLPDLHSSVAAKSFSFLLSFLFDSLKSLLLQTQPSSFIPLFQFFFLSISPLPPLQLPSLLFSSLDLLQDSVRIKGRIDGEIVGTTSCRGVELG